MNDEMIVKKAIENIDINIKAQVHVLQTGRNATGNAEGLNVLMLAKQHLESMIGNTPVEAPALDGIKVDVPSKKQTITCEHCGKVSNHYNHTKWHGDKCKSKK